MLDNFADEVHVEEWLKEFHGKTDEYVHCFNIVRDKLFGPDFDDNRQVNVHALPVLNEITRTLILNTNQRIIKKYKELYPDHYGPI
jgi:hypothetical protein